MASLVIPSIRAIRLDYLEAVLPTLDRIIVVDDSDGNIKPSHPKMEVYDYGAQRRALGEFYDVIPHKTPACRNFGLFLAYRDGTDVISIDDDCLLDADFAEGHRTLGVRATVDKFEGWFDTLSCLKLTPGPQDWFARGYPYWLRRQHSSSRSRAVTGRVVANMGLWAGVPDINGVDKLLVQEDLREPFPVESLGLQGDGPASAEYFPFCSMNFGVLCEAIPAMMQMPMGWVPCPDWDVHYFDDIWSGYVAQKLINVCGDLFTFGRPLVRHLKQGNLRREVVTQHYGHLLSPYFYELVDSVTVRPGPYEEMYGALAEDMLANLGLLKAPTLYVEMFGGIAQKMARWATLCLRNAPRGVR